SRPLPRTPPFPTRRSSDLAPLLPVYHRALASGFEGPVAVLNLGGVGNITFLGADETMIAFDTGPGNALIDDWVRGTQGIGYDARSEEHTSELQSRENLVCR